jgi:hypothetical protein
MDKKLDIMDRVVHSRAGWEIEMFTVGLASTSV